VTPLSPDSITTEQMQRLAETWRESAPSVADVRSLRVRLAARRAPTRSRFRVLALALAQGFVLGGVTLAAAAWVGHALPSFERLGSSEPKRTSEPPPRAHGRGGPGSLAAGSVRRPSGDVPAVAAFGDMTPDPARVPFEMPSVPSTTPARGYGVSRSAARRAERPGAEAMAPPPTESHPAEESPQVNSDGPWARVAQALSASDWLRADKALLELVATADPATRDAAELARAELWIAHGHGAALRANVERLAASGYTPLIRKRAARLLERLR
jgi:hypothetical protein